MDAFEQKPYELKQGDGVLQTEIKRILNMLSCHTNDLWAEGKKILEEEQKNESTPQTVIQPWISKVINDLTNFKFNNHEFQQIGEPQESEIQIHG